MHAYTDMCISEKAAAPLYKQNLRTKLLKWSVIDLNCHNKRCD